MKYALLDTSNVVIQTDVSPQSGYLECPDYVVPGFIYQNGSWVAPETGTSEGEKHEGVNREYTRRMSLGIKFEGNTYQCDELARQNIMAKGSTADKYLASGQDPSNLNWYPGQPDSPFTFRTMDNKNIQMNAQTMAQLAEATEAWVYANRAASWALKDASPIPENYEDDEHWPTQNSPIKPPKKIKKR